MANWLLYCGEWLSLPKRGFWLLGFMGPLFITVAEFSDPSDQELGFLLPVAKWIHEHRLVFVLRLLGLQLFCGGCVFAMTRMHPFDRKKVEEILDVAVAHHFAERDHGDHEYRATLFKIRWFPGVGEWLGIVCRSGKNYRRSNSVFSLDRMKKLNCSGIAGECARQGAEIVLDLSGASPNDYAEKGYLADAERSDMNVQSKVFFAIPVVRQDGRPWGVLVLDTTDQTQAPGRNTQGRVQNDLGHWGLALKTAIRH